MDEIRNQITSSIERVNLVQINRVQLGTEQVQIDTYIYNFLL